MKDTYWLLLGIFGLYAMVACTAYYFASQRAERLRVEGELRQIPKKAKSIWTRDLFDTRFGRFFAAYIFAPTLILYGILATTEQEVRYKGFTYHGFDAVCIGIGIVCLGLGAFVFYGMPNRNEKEVKIRASIIWVTTAAFVICFATALLRNI